MLRSRLRANDGFSLVELLIAILIVAILMAIGLALLLNQRAKAQDTGAKAATVTASKAMLAYSTDHGSYADATTADLVTIERSLAEALNLTVDSTASSFTVSVDSLSSEGSAFTIQRTSDGAVIRECTKPGTGSCRTTADANGNRW